MRGIVELAGDPAARRFLEARGVHMDPQTFMDALRPPASGGLADLLGVPRGDRLVYLGQQCHLDLRASVVAKFRAAVEVGRGPDVAVAPLWLDTDRAGADRWTTTVVWPVRQPPLTHRLVPQRVRSLETRYIEVTVEALERFADELGSWLGALIGDPDARVRAEVRLKALREGLLEERPPTLAAASRFAASFLLRQVMGFDGPSAFISLLAERGLLSDAMNAMLANLDDVVAVFNHAIEELVAADVDPQVRPIDDRYLPLHYSCDACGARRKLLHEREGGDHFAVAECSCGARYRFHLGSGTPSLGELQTSGRWSADVSVVMFLNDLAGGAVAGKSSALYGLVFNRVLDKVLGRTPIPVLMPPSVIQVMEHPPEVDSLLFHYLVGPSNQ